MFNRPTAAIIRLDHLLHNFQVIRKLAGPDSPIAPVIKSNAYGHGMVAIARELSRAGAEWLAVSLTEEGLDLRESGLAGPILILGGCYPGQAEEIVTSGLTPVVATAELARALNEAARLLGRPVPIHLKVETGLGRLGILFRDIPAFLQHLKGMSFLQLEGICTSFSSVDNLEERQEISSTSLSARPVSWRVNGEDRYFVTSPIRGDCCEALLARDGSSGRGSFSTVTPVVWIRTMLI